MRVHSHDFHTGGEPFRVVRAGEGDVPAIPGTTVAERRVAAMAEGAPIDEVRRLLCHEPRGHTDMYGGFIVPPDDEGADFGVLFWHKDGYSTACGHGTMALGVWAIEEGLVAIPDAPPGEEHDVDVTMDVPSGRVIARTRIRDGRVQSVTFVSVPAFVRALDVPVATSRGEVLADISFGGAMYAQVRAADVGLRVHRDDYRALVDIGREIKWALNEHPAAQHPRDERLSGIYGTILFDELGDWVATDGRAGGPHQRNIAIFADGEADRSPCGSGTAARCATLRERGIMAPDATLRHDSIVGSTFFATADNAEGGSVLPIVTGSAHRTGEHTFIRQPDDELETGFLLQ